MAASWPKATGNDADDVLRPRHGLWFNVNRGQTMLLTNQRSYAFHWSLSSTIVVSAHPEVDKGDDGELDSGGGAEAMAMATRGQD